MNQHEFKLAKWTLLLLPILLLCGCARPAKPARIHPVSLPGTASETAAEAAPSDAETIITLRVGETCEDLPLDVYLMGVLSAELPPTFSLEAMKAQAIASRTFALDKQARGEILCNDPACCQAYRAAETPSETIRQAVTETDGLVLTYDGALIQATFFSSSGGMTEAAAEVWGGEVPYLQSVESPGEDFAPRNQETFSLARTTFLSVLETIRPVDATAEPLIGEITHTQGGGVRSIVIGGVPFTGLELRGALDLRSTDFTLEEQGSVIRITTRGSGHRVGMSQYGAEAMARSGASAAEILAHYYPGTTLTKAASDEAP